jgi:hypothetical protein
MASKFAIGDKVDQAFSNHAEGTIVAILTDGVGDRRSSDCRACLSLTSSAHGPAADDGRREQ